MDAEVFYSEFFRVVHTTRKRLIREQLADLNEVGFRLNLTVAERSITSFGDMTISEGIAKLQARLWRIRRGE